MRGVVTLLIIIVALGAFSVFSLNAFERIEKGRVNELEAKVAELEGNIESTRKSTSARIQRERSHHEETHQMLLAIFPDEGDRENINNIFYRDDSGEEETSDEQETEESDEEVNAGDEQDDVSWIDGAHGVTSDGEDA